MRILFIAKPVSPEGNGVVTALKSQILHLQTIADVALWNIGVELKPDIADRLFQGPDYATVASLPEPYCKPDIVIFEEVYKMEYVRLYRECLKMKIPYVVIPHGCLVDAEQNKKKLKHMAANILLFNRFLRKACAVQYLNQQEREASHFRCKDTLLIPNSIPYQPRRFQRDTEIFRYLYVGRYDILTKGLDLLIDTFAGLKDWCLENRVVLELYGPTENNPQVELVRQRILEHGCESFIFCNGPVYGQQKEETMQRASAFIQTSRNEGQPMSIIEALSYGLPCVVTYGTSFGEYCEENHCGFGVPFSQEALAEAVQKLFSDTQGYESRCQNAVSAMMRDFELKAVARMTLDAYCAIIKK